MIDAPISELVAPQFCVGGTLDIPTAKFIPGEHGEYIMNSGLGAINSITGPENSFKTGLALALAAMIQSRHLHLADVTKSKAIEGIRQAIFESEGSLSYQRIEAICEQFPVLSELDFTSSEIAKVIQLTPQSKMWMDAYFDKVKDASKKRAAEAGKGQGLLTTPFPGHDGKAIKMMAPMIVTIDTLTEGKASVIEDDFLDEHSVGDGSLGTMFMKDGISKTQMISQMPTVASQGGFLGNVMFLMTAHVAPKIEMGGMFAPQEQKLTFSRRGATTKGTSKKFAFINNNLIEIFEATPLFNSSSDKTPKYPMDESDKTEGNTDLMLVKAVNTRNKNGQSGYRFNLIVSQSEGFQPELSDFYHCKETAKSKEYPQGFGLTGSDQSYAFDLYPDYKLRRTTVRRGLKEDPLLARACELTCQLSQLQRTWHLDPQYRISPAELRKSLEDKGYDWNVLLDTRGWWTFKEFEPYVRQPYLSIFDLLRMHTGEYHPYWLPKK